MYLNPVNATNQTFGCHGPLLVEFVAVYWLAPFLGTAVGFALGEEVLASQFANGALIHGEIQRAAGQ